MNKLPQDFEMDKYGLHVRLVNEGDAEFIVKIRTDSKLSKYIHETSNDIQKQREWIKEYKQREKEGLEYYFIFFYEGSPVGLNRIYNIHGDVFTTGSWIFLPDAPFECCVASSIIVRQLAFEELLFTYEDGYDGVHVNNKKVIRFNKLIGLKETGRLMSDKGEYITMGLTRDDFEHNKDKLIRMIGY